MSRLTRSAGVLLLAAAATATAAAAAGTATDYTAETPVSPLTQSKLLHGDSEELSEELNSIVREYFLDPLNSLAAQEEDGETAHSNLTQNDGQQAQSPQRFFASGVGLPTDNIFSLDPVVPEGSFFNSADYEAVFDNLVDKLPIDQETYDYIVVGGGAGGCAVADILSQYGLKVLLLERGMERSAGTTPNAMSARGAGIGLADATISQAVGTVQGVRTFSGAIMGGSTSVNLGIVAGETERFFEEMALQFPGFNINYQKLKRAYDYIADRVATAMPMLPPFGPAFKSALLSSGYRFWGGGSHPEPSLFVRMGYQWVGYSLFDANNNLQRNAADTLLVKVPNLTVKTRHTVRSVNFVDSPNGKTASCVVYRPTKYKDIRPIGDLWSFFPSSAADWAPWVGSFLEPHSVLVTAGVDEPKRKLRRVCLTQPGRGRVILSGGAVHTPLILYRSGIGPALQVGMLKVPQILDNPAVGSTFSDRTFITIPGFLKHYVDTVPLVNPSRSLRRLHATDDVNSWQVNKLRLTRNPMIVPIRTMQALEEAVPPAIREAIRKIVSQPIPTEIITINEDEDQPVSTRFNPPVLLPDFKLFPGKMKVLAPALQPRVCQFMGIKYFGPNCHGEVINERNLGCTAVIAEELSGDRTAEGFLYASRYMFPTVFRKDPILDAISELLLGCANYRAPFGILLLKPLCAIAQPVIKCLRKSVAPFFFTSEPKSRGSIRMKPTGEVVIDPQYLVHEQDLFDAVRGVSSMIEQMNGDSYKGILQPKGPQSCPLAVLNGLLDLLLALGSTTSPFLTNSTNFAEIQRYLQDLLPTESRRLRRLMVVNAGYKIKPAIYEDEDGNEYEDFSPFIEEDVDEVKMERLGIKRRLEAVGFDFEAYREHISGTDASAKNPSRHLGMLERRLDEAITQALGPEKMDGLKQYANSLKMDHTLKISGDDAILRDAIEACNRPCSQASIDDKTCPKYDICCTAHGNAKCIKIPGQPSFAGKQGKEVFSSADGAQEGDTVKTEEFLAPLFGIDPSALVAPRRPQWAATYPPTLPSTNNPKALAKFALSYMTSIGHVYGSAPMGTVVDDKFQVIGVNGLSITDASVLPQLTRVNPAFTVMALGRYAGEIMLGI